MENKKNKILITAVAGMFFSLPFLSGCSGQQITEQTPMREKEQAVTVSTKAENKAEQPKADSADKSNIEEQVIYVNDAFIRNKEQLDSVRCVEESADRVVLTAEAYYKLPSEDYLYPNGRLEFAYDLSEGCIFRLRDSRDMEIVRRGGYLNSIANIMYKQYFDEEFPYQGEK